MLRIIKYLQTPTLLELLEVMAVGCSLVFTASNPQSLLLGGWIAAVGVALLTWTAGFRNDEGGDGQLTFGGPYRFLRYPAVLSRFLIVLGLIIVCRRPSLFIVALVGLAPFYRQLMRREDAWLAAELGPVAAEYRSIVSGFIPQFLPAKLTGFSQSRPSVTFSWARALWQGPFRASTVMAVVAVAWLSQYVWVERILLEWQWRVAALGLVVIALGFFMRKSRLYRPRG